MEGVLAPAISWAGHAHCDQLVDHSAVISEAEVVLKDDDNPPLPLEANGPTGALVTYLELDPVTVWKGSITSDTVYMRSPGGYHDGIFQIWDHVPPFHVGDRIVVFARPSGSPALLNAVNLLSGVFFLRDGNLVELGSGFTITAFDVGDPPGLYLPDLWDNESSDGNCAPDGSDCYTGNGGLTTDVPPMTPLSWADFRTAVAACVAAVPQPTEPAATIDHTGVTP